MPDVLLATDAEWIRDEVDAAIGGPDLTVRWVRSGAEVVDAAAEIEPELVILDLQIGNMGGMAACTALRHESGSGRAERMPILMLLDREADIFLARRCDADGWLVKPLDSLRLRKAAQALLGGGRYEEAEATSTA